MQFPDPRNGTEETKGRLMSSPRPVRFTPNAANDDVEVKTRLFRV